MRLSRTVMRLMLWGTVVVVVLGASVWIEASPLYDSGPAIDAREKGDEVREWLQSFSIVSEEEAYAKEACIIPSTEYITWSEYVSGKERLIVHLREMDPPYEMLDFHLAWTALHVDYLKAARKRPPGAVATILQINGLLDESMLLVHELKLQEATTVISVESIRYLREHGCLPDE